MAECTDTACMWHGWQHEGEHRNRQGTMFWHTSRPSDFPNE